MGTKLHELLAVKSNQETQATKTIGDLTNTFEKKKSHFGATIKTFTSRDENSLPKTEEISEIQTTVGAEVAWLSNIWKKAIDVSYQVDLANTQAFAEPRSCRRHRR